MSAFSLNEEVKALKAQLDDVVRQRDELAQQLEASRFDPLTGLLKRLEFHDLVCERLREEQKGTLIVLDLDGFKLINDQFGHTVGDVLIRRVGARLSEWAAPGTLLGRYGGEEFAVFVPHVDEADAANLCETLLQLFRRPHAIHGTSLVVTVSIGFTDCVDLSLDELLRRADIALYAAKSRGRDRAVAFGAAIETIPAARRELASIVVNLQQQLMAVRDEARTDALTGLFNRRALEETMAAIQSNGATLLGIAFVDLDHFGVINHTQGDAAGDRVLQQVATALRAAVRQDDLVFRKGGEEFVVLMPGIAGQAATLAAARMLDAVRALGIPNQGGSGGTHLTATVGVSTTAGQATYWSVLEQASAVAMQAKETQGRNAVHTWSSAEPNGAG
jgi:diguanylate cyclase (GGDEF)-like protein